jgi:hypothetical protein
MTSEDIQTIRSAVQRKLHVMPEHAKSAFERANAAAKVSDSDKPEETDNPSEEELEDPKFEKAVNPGPGLTFRLRKATDDEKVNHLNSDATRKVAVVVNSKADKLAAAIERQRRIGKSKITCNERRTSFDRASDALADAMLKIRERKRR